MVSAMGQLMLMLMPRWCHAPLPHRWDAIRVALGWARDRAEGGPLYPGPQAQPARASR